jgi:hypothetical protein
LAQYFQNIDGDIMNSLDFNIAALFEHVSKHSGEIIGLIAAATAPLFNRLKVLRVYQFGIPSVFNLFGFLFVIPVCLFVWTMQPSVIIYNGFPYIAAIGVIVILISFLNGYCYKKAGISQRFKLFRTGFGLITYAIGISMIVFSINAFSMLNNYYIFCGKVVAANQTNTANISVSLNLGGSQKSKFVTRTNCSGEYVFFLTRAQICNLNTIELSDSKRTPKEMRYIDLWPGLDPNCINETDSTISNPAKRYQFQEDLQI